MLFGAGLWGRVFSLSRCQDQIWEHSPLSTSVLTHQSTPSIFIPQTRKAVRQLEIRAGLTQFSEVPGHMLQKSPLFAPSPAAAGWMRHTPRGQEQLHGAPSVHSFCGAALGGLHVNAPYLIESLRQFPYTILLCVYLPLSREYCAWNNLLSAHLGVVYIPLSGACKSAVWKFFWWCFILALPGRSTEPDFTSAAMSSASEMLLGSVSFKIGTN